MAAFTVDLPDDIVASLRLPPGEVASELRKELALALYARGALSLGKARELAGLSMHGFLALLGERRIPRHYGERELSEDLDYARRGG